MYQPFGLKIKPKVIHLKSKTMVKPFTNNSKPTLKKPRK